MRDLTGEKIFDASQIRFPQAAKIQPVENRSRRIKFSFDAHEQPTQNFVSPREQVNGGGIFERGEEKFVLRVIQPQRNDHAKKESPDDIFKQ